MPSTDAGTETRVGVGTEVEINVGIGTGVGAGTGEKTGRAGKGPQKKKEDSSCMINLTLGQP